MLLLSVVVLFPEQKDKRVRTLQRHKKSWFDKQDEKVEVKGERSWTWIAWPKYVVLSRHLQNSIVSNSSVHSLIFFVRKWPCKHGNFLTGRNKG